MYVCDWRTDSGGAGKLSATARTAASTADLGGTSDQPALAPLRPRQLGQDRQQAEEELLKMLASRGTAATATAPRRGTDSAAAAARSASCCSPSCSTASRTCCGRSPLLEPPQLDVEQQLRYNGACLHHASGRAARHPPPLGRGLALNGKRGGCHIHCALLRALADQNLALRGPSHRASDGRGFRPPPTPPTASHHDLH